MGKDANGILTYMYMMLDEAKKNQISLTRESFQSFGRNVELFRGVRQWFSFINEYGGKIAAALSRQHPRDLFDCKYMEVSDFAQIRKGLILCLLGSDKPIVESLVPNSIDQTEALEKHFQGMSEVEFSYADYEASRQELQRWVNNGLTLADKEFLISFERGEPDWALCDAGDLSIFPSVQWKLKNILKLKESNPKKFEKGIQLITDLFSL